MTDDKPNPDDLAELLAVIDHVNRDVWAFKRGTPNTDTPEGENLSAILLAYRKLIGRRS